MHSNHLFYQMSIDEVMNNFHTDVNGLKSAEAKTRLKTYGENKLKEVGKEPMILKFIKQFKDLMVIILIVSGSLSLYLGEYRDATIMYAIVLINAIISFFQEYRSEKMMDSLKSLIKAKAKVIRNGEEIEVEGTELVIGDIVKLEEGDSVPADLRVMEEHNLATNDFALTGESNPTRKFLHKIPGNAAIGDRNNLTFMGTTVATGNGLGIVIATGMQTEIGRIANLSQETTTELSPLQKELNNLAKQITVITLSIGAVLFAVGLALNFSLKEAFLFALGIAASCVPEGLPAEVSVALSLAAGRLAKKDAIVKKLSAVETMGSTHIICTDKTGTLTKNEMTVIKMLIGGKEYEVTGTGYEPNGTICSEDGKCLTKNEIGMFRLFFENGVFASNAHVNPPDAEHKVWYAIGDPTEAALITLAEKAGVKDEEINKESPEIHEYTFDSVRKRMSSVRKRDGKFVVYVKGSPQSVLEKCTKFWDGEKVRDITDKDKGFINEKDDDYANLALRNLGFAYREMANYDENTKMEDVEEELIWLGVVSMIDPPRDEVKDAMDSAAKAHIRVIIITGDYALTAKAIAKKINLHNEGMEAEITVINGDELEKTSDVDLLHKMQNTNLIFSRTSPEDKLRIVGLLKKAGEVVAVTGDGVNDAPALKKADIGVAMGRTGTDVAKDSAEIVLLDDSFATLVVAIKEGRVIFQNLKKTILASLQANGAELGAVLCSLIGTSIFHWPLAILAVQILAIDLVGELLPLASLTWDPPSERIMTEEPRNPNEHIMNKYSMIDVAWTGLLMGIIAYLNFLFLFVREGQSLINVGSDSIFYMRATTLTYVSIVFAQWANIMSRRAGGRESVFTKYFWSNRRLLLSFVLSGGLILLICYNPFVANYLRTAPLTMMDWICAAGGALIYLVIREIYKIFHRRKMEALEKVAALKTI